MMLNIEDVKVGDELECIDREGYLNSDEGHSQVREMILSSPIVVKEINALALNITQEGFCIPVASLKYFKKKEQSQYTFDDLIDVANDAVKNKLITQTRFSLSAIGTPLLIVVYFDGREGRYTDDNLLNGIEFIQSLYKETFVIECADDIKRIKNNAKIKLNGGQSIKFINDNGLYNWFVEGVKVPLSFDFIKGATVTQSK